MLADMLRTEMSIKPSSAPIFRITSYLDACKLFVHGKGGGGMCVKKKMEQIKKCLVFFSVEKRLATSR